MALGRVPVWPFFALGLVAGAIGIAFVVAWALEPPPEEASLEMVSGTIVAVTTRGDLPGMPGYSGASGLESTYFTLDNVPGEFRYPSAFPRYFEVRDRVSVAVDIWVDPIERAAGGPMTVWQIVEHNPNNIIGKETTVTHAEIVATLLRVDQSMVRAGWWLLGIAAPFMVLGLAARRWNRGKPPPMP
ncbi:MAG: hypothetical protein EXQ94_14355 [Alphaproteobacteria bacterium]|nr:hypothetical protein [Alphaproteobacteria bacterium]